MTKTLRICDRCKKEVSHLYDMPRLICEGLSINVYPSKVELCEVCAKQACAEFNTFAERWIVNE